MKISRVVAAAGYGGYYWHDEAAAKQGKSRKDGTINVGEPVTPGFKAVMEPSRAVIVMLMLEDGSVAYGDACTVANGGRSGRDPLLRPEVYLPIVQGPVTELLEGQELDDFGRLNELLEATTVNGAQLHAGLRYGVSQALLDGVARAKSLTMAEVLADFVGTTVAETRPAFFGQSGKFDWIHSVEKMILRRIEVLPQAAIHSAEMYGDMFEHIPWVVKRSQEIAGDDYAPILHYDTHGHMALVHDDNLDRMLEDLARLTALAGPFQLQIEDPLVASSQAEQMERIRDIRSKVAELGINVGIVADEWCNTVQDVRAYVDAGVADMLQIKAPDLGSVANIARAVQYCNAHGTGSYLGGSCAETPRAAQVTAHVGLATSPTQMLAKPGMGVDEAVALMENEMAMVSALRKARDSARYATV